MSTRWTGATVGAFLSQTCTDAMDDKARIILRFAAVIMGAAMSVAGIGISLEPLLGEFSKLAVLAVVPVLIIYWHALDPLLTREAELRFEFEAVQQRMRTSHGQTEQAGKQFQASPKAGA